MTHKKLQKLCYYAYSWCLTLTGNELFNDGFEAWVHGPVNRELYATYADYGWNEIPKLDNNLEEFLIEKTNTKLIEEVYRIYGSLSGDQLEALTHQEQPWLEARQGLNEWEASRTTIDKEMIKNFYRSQLDA